MKNPTANDIKCEGRAWVFGDNVDTDQISPGKALTLSLDEQKQFVFEALRPEFSKQVKSKDVIVAGKNFGCGSSREHSPEVLKAMGVGAILAESFGRIFFRNAIAIGLPALYAPEIRKSVADGDMIEVNVEDAAIFNRTTGKNIFAKPLDQSLIDILKAGGIIEMLKKEASSS